MSYANTEETQKAQQTTDFLVGLFERADPYGTGTQLYSDTLTTSELLERGVERTQSELSDQPGVQATTMYTLGRIYRRLGYHDEAASLLDDALAVQREHLSPAHPDRAKSLRERPLLLRYKGQTERAARLYRKSLSTQWRHLGENHPNDADSIREELFPEMHPSRSAGLNNVGWLLQKKGDYATADSLH